MKAIAIFVFVICGLICAYAATMFARSAPEITHGMSPTTAIFLFVFFGLGSLTLPLVIAIPRHVSIIQKESVKNESSVASDS